MNRPDRPIVQNTDLQGPVAGRSLIFNRPLLRELLSGAANSDDPRRVPLPSPRGGELCSYFSLNRRIVIVWRLLGGVWLWDIWGLLPAKRNCSAPAVGKRHVDAEASKVGCQA